MFAAPLWDSLGFMPLTMILVVFCLRGGFVRVRVTEMKLYTQTVNRTGHLMAYILSPQDQEWKSNKKKDIKSNPINFFYRELPKPTCQMDLSLGGMVRAGVLSIETSLYFQSKNVLWMPGKLGLVPIEEG